MPKTTKALLVLAFFIVPVISLAAAEIPRSFSPYVDSKGNISLPQDFMSAWVHLGTWVVTSEKATGPEVKKTAPGTGLHDLYTQPESFKAYKKNGKWPDGAILVMEIRAMKWDDLPTGHVIYPGEATDWFVMVKDSKGRFKDNPNWGGGWGWAFFKAADPKKNISTNYRNDCLGCHEVAKDSDWVFIQGYPTLR
jgi:cytochrome c